MIQETEEKALVSQALEARKLAYAPYSGYTVGAALLTADGHRYLGGNIENASYGATNCAERTAFFKAVSEGEREFTAIAIAGGISREAPVEYAYPCGICRQVMQEFCRDDFVIYVVNSEQDYQRYTLKELLPFGFGGDAINARILTMEPGREVFYGEVWVKNDKIAYVAEQKELAEEWDKSQFPRIAWDIELDCKGNLLMPGFKNAHTHSGMTFLRSMADDLPLDQWLNKQVFPLEAKLTGEDIYELTRLAVLEYLTSGVTSIFDMYLTPDTIAEACLDTGMRCVLVSGLNNFSSSPKQVEEEFLKWNKKNSLISYQLGFHAEYTCSKELLWKVSEMAHHYRTPVYAHISETEKEVEECKARYGMTPPMFLDSLGMFDFGGGGFHCVHVTEQDMDVFRRHRMYVITNPGSNTKLASGIAPIADYVRHKIPVAI